MALNIILRWLEDVQIFSKNGQSMKTYAIAILVLIVVWLFIRVTITAVTLPYTLKESQKAMQVIIANAQNQFGDPQQMNPQQIERHSDCLREN